MTRIAIAACLCVLTCVTAMAQTQPATRDVSQPRQCGKIDGDLHASAAVETPWANGTPASAPLRVVVENVGANKLDAKGAFVWAFVMQSKEKAFFTDKIPLAYLSKVARDGADTFDATLDLAKLKVFPYQADLKLADGYPVTDAPSPGTLGQLLALGRVRGRVMVYVPDRGVLLKSNDIDAVIGSDLIGLFARDEFAAKNAHDLAVKRGADAVPELVDALDKGSLPWFGQMWAATALCDIKDDRALPVLTKLVAKGGNLANVIAYHGPKMANAKLDDAITAAAQNDPGVAAWAARGFATNGRGLKPELVDAGLQSKDPRIRAGLAEALLAKPNEADATRLAKLITDDDASVRQEVAAHIAKAANLPRSATVISALLTALDPPNDDARAAICDALAKITGRKASYDAKASPADKAAFIAGWKTWWAAAKVDWK